jgi:hypothetical protein
MAYRRGLSRNLPFEGLKRKYNVEMCEVRNKLFESRSAKIQEAACSGCSIRNLSNAGIPAGNGFSRRLR